MDAVEEPILRLKTAYCIIRWLCDSSAVLSYCNADWRPARSDDIAAGSERRVYPLALRRNKGQWLWVHKEYKNISLFSCFTSLYNYPFLPFFASISPTLLYGFEEIKRTWKLVALKLWFQWSFSLRFRSLFLCPWQKIMTVLEKVWCIEKKMMFIFVCSYFWINMPKWPIFFISP